MFFTQYEITDTKKGGVKVYVRNNLSVVNVSRSNAFELISITLALPSSHKMLPCGLYHPPKVRYHEHDLIECISDIVDMFLQENQNWVVICGGDFNQLNTEEFSFATGLEILVDFPTRGNSTLDYCCTNCPDLFGKCFPINTLTKTDHKGVVLPGGKKLKPLRYKYELRDK